MIDCTTMVYVEIEANCHDRSNRMRSITKTRHDNDITIDHIGSLFIGKEIELS